MLGVKEGAAEIVGDELDEGAAEIEGTPDGASSCRMRDDARSDCLCTPS